MALLALATREPPRRLIVVALCAAAAVATMVAVMGHDLARALALIPTGDYIGDMFGSSTLAGGLYGTFATAGAPGRIVLQAAMTIAALAIAAWQGTRPARAIELAALDARERAFLIAGAMLVLGCFFTAQNIGYRTIHLILALPALTALRRAGPPGSRYGWTVAAILLLLWSQGWRLLVHLGAGYFPPVTGLAIEIMAWLVREALWWWTVTMLATLALALLSRSEAAEAMLAALPRPLRAIAN